MAGEGARTAGDETGEAGFVLLSVLLVAGLFTAVAAGMALRTGLLAMQTANRVEAVRAQALVDGAALFAADTLRPGQAASLSEAMLIEAAMAGRAARAPEPTDRPVLPGDGTPLACRLSNGDALETVAVDQGALPDLNGASVPMLRDVLAAAGLPGEAARRLADEIADYRDPDDAPQNNGIGERAQYAERGLAWGPANAPFADAGEIAQLPSATPDLVSRLRPLFTVANPRSGLDLALAPGASAGRLPEGAAKLPGLSRWDLASTRTAFAVEARLRRNDGSIAASRAALVSFEDGKQSGFKLQRWSRPPVPAEGDAAPARSGDARFCALLQFAFDAPLRR